MRKVSNHLGFFSFPRRAVSLIHKSCGTSITDWFITKDLKWAHLLKYL